MEGGGDALMFDWYHVTSSLMSPTCAILNHCAAEALNWSQAAAPQLAR